MKIQIDRVGPRSAERARRALASLASWDPAPAPELAALTEESAVVAWVAHRGESPAGYVIAYLLDRLDGRRMCLIYDVEVAPSHRRSGVGTALVEEVLRHAAAAGAFKTFVITNESNSAARGLYESLGGTTEPDGAVLFGWSHPPRITDP
jgi:ribosomal protein S18 acetylase RimI-like enzyme